MIGVEVTKASGKPSHFFERGPVELGSNPRIGKIFSSEKKSYIIAIKVCKYSPQQLWWFQHWLLFSFGVLVTFNLGSNLHLFFLLRSNTSNDRSGDGQSVQTMQDK